MECSAQESCGPQDKETGEAGARATGSASRILAVYEDGKAYLEPAVVSASIVLQGMLASANVSAARTDRAATVFLPFTIDALLVVNSFYSQHADSPFPIEVSSTRDNYFYLNENEFHRPAYEKAIRNSCERRYITWARSLSDVQRREALLLADFLDAKDLVCALLCVFRDRLLGKSSDEVREIAGLPDDLSAQEKDAFSLENVAFEETI